MKKRSKILICIVVLFLIMAVGYAIFTKQLFINGTASASGNMDLTYKCIVKDEVGGTGACKVEDSTITTTSTLTKPTDNVVYDILIENTGSIPVVLKGITSPNNVSQTDPSVAGDEAYLDRTTLISSSYLIGAKMDAEGWFDPINIFGDQAVADAKITLYPGDTIFVDISYSWIDSKILNMTQPVLPEGGARIDYNVTFNFEQTTN